MKIDEQKERSLIDFKARDHILGHKGGKKNWPRAFIPRVINEIPGCGHASIPGTNLQYPYFFLLSMVSGKVTIFVATT